MTTIKATEARANLYKLLDRASESHEPIQITAFNKTVALNNCQVCHGDFVSRINHQGQTDLEDCTRCHATVGHDQNSAGKP